MYVDNHFLKRYEDIDLHNNFINRVKAGTQDMDGVNKKQVDDALALKVNKAGDIMAGNLDMGDKKIINLSNPTSNSDACTKNIC